MIVPRRSQKTGEISYQVRISLPGGGKKTIGTFNKKGKRDGSEPETAYWAEAKALAHAATPGLGLGVREFYETWESQDFPRLRGRKLKHGGVKRYRLYLRPFLDAYGDRQLNGITRTEAFNFAHARPGSLNYVRSMFAHARDLGALGLNPFSGLGLDKGPGRRDNDPLTEAQLHELADAALRVAWSHPYGDQFRALIIFAAYTGLRPGEVCAVQWADLDGNRLHVRRSIHADGTVGLPKSNKEREIFFPPPARAVLSSFPRNLRSVFTGQSGEMLRPRSLLTYFEKTRVEAGMPNVVPHELRHFCGHHFFVRLNQPARVVAEQLGHRDGGRLVETLYGHGGHGALEELERAWPVAQ